MGLGDWEVFNQPAVPDDPFERALSQEDFRSKGRKRSDPLWDSFLLRQAPFPGDAPGTKFWPGRAAGQSSQACVFSLATMKLPKGIHCFGKCLQTEAAFVRPCPLHTCFRTLPEQTKCPCHRAWNNMAEPPVPWPTKQMPYYRLGYSQPPSPTLFTPATHIQLRTSSACASLAGASDLAST